MPTIFLLGGVEVWSLLMSEQALV